MKIRLLFLLAAIVLLTCKKFEDASPTPRNSLIRFYGGSLSYQGVKAEQDQDGGYIVVGNIVKNDFVSDLVIIKTNSLGQKMWQKTIPNSSASDIKIVADGYLIAGDGIDYNPNPINITELVNTRARVIKMDFSQTVLFDMEKKDSMNVGTVTAPVYYQIDFHGDAITFDNSGGIILLGSTKTPETGSFQKSTIDGLDASTGNRKWTREYNLDVRDYFNSRAIHLTSDNNLVWAMTSERTSQSITDAYLTLVCAGINTIEKNKPNLGDNSVDHYYTSADIQGSQNVFGIIGTFAKTDGTGSNIYFVRAMTNN